MKETAYLLQAALVTAWWIGLFSSRRFFDAFQYESIPPTAFWAFFLPDVTVIALLSTIRAYRNLAFLEHIVLGAFGYAALYCLNATLLTGTGFMPTGLMLIGLAYNFFLCFNPSLFRVSTSTSFAINASKTLVQIVCIWFLALIVVPFILSRSFGISTELRGDSLGWVSIAMFLGFSALGLTSSYYMVRDGHGTPLPLDQTNALVVSGPYRFVRNPMAIAGIGQGLAIAAMFQSIPILIYALLGAVVWHLVVRPIEENDMIRRFGASYLAYRDQVTCWLPKFRDGSD